MTHCKLESAKWNLPTFIFFSLKVLLIFNYMWMRVLQTIGVVGWLAGWLAGWLTVSLVAWLHGLILPTYHWRFCTFDCLGSSVVWHPPRGLFVGCLTSRQHTSVSQGRICTDNFTCCHTEIEVADQTFYLTQSQYTDTGPTSHSADPITPGAWQGSHWSASFEVTGMTRPGKIPAQAGFELRISRSRGGRFNH